MKENIKEVENSKYKGNVIYSKNAFGDEVINAYDSKSNLIYTKNPTIEEWFDSRGNLIHDKSVMLGNKFHEYDKNNNLIHTILIRRDYVHEIWNEYDEKGNRIRYRHSNGREESYTYDENGDRTTTVLKE